MLMKNVEYDYDFKRILFGKYTVFTNFFGDLELADNDYEMVMQDRVTGVHIKINIDDFVHMIKTVFPDKEEQMSLLKQIFRD